MIVDGTKNSRIGFIQPAGGKSSEVVGIFQSFIQQADTHAKDVPAEQAAMPEHLRHPALRDIVSAFHNEKATGHEHIMRKLRELE